MFSRGIRKLSEMNANRWCSREALEYRVPVCLIKYCHIINVGTARGRMVTLLFSPFPTAPSMTRYIRTGHPLSEPRYETDVTIGTHPHLSAATDKDCQ